uniref:Uncharacterized protein n=1 Tax=Schistocephalus solidus TaxID=70667 RepID=A0A183T613_SCHSO
LPSGQIPGNGLNQRDKPDEVIPGNPAIPLLPIPPPTTHFRIPTEQAICNPTIQGATGRNEEEHYSHGTGSALSETRVSEQHQLEEVCAGYTFFWSCRTKGRRGGPGVAFAI